MSSPVAVLEAVLQAMLELKPPGISGSRVQAITVLCVDNVQSESVLVQKLYTHLKKAPPTHKLGVLYVVDSVTRKWTESAKQAGQLINNTAEDGTFAAGVNRVQELLPVLMHDIIQTAPANQKEKIKKLIDIWEKGQTFPLQALNSFKAELGAVHSQENISFTPPGSPPPNLIAPQVQGLLQGQNTQPVVSVPLPTPTNGSGDVLAALGRIASMARQNAAAAAPPPSNQKNAPLQAPVMKQAYPPVSSVNQPGNFASPALSFSNGGQNYASNQATAHSAVPPTMTPVMPSKNVDPAVLQQQVALFKTLSAAGMPIDQIAGLIAGLAQNAGTAPPVPIIGPAGRVPHPQFASQNQIPVAHNGQNGFNQSHVQNQNGSQNGSQNGWGARPNEARDRNGPDRVQERRRSRSPSPSRGWNGVGSPNSRRRNDHFEGDRSPGRNRDDRGRGDNRVVRADNYRQRSPSRWKRSPTPPRQRGADEKWIEFDPSLPEGNIKVLSRTLFVGGVTMPEYELRRIFEPFGRVQTCIVNKDKRHAFVKMFTRADAVTARDGMEKNRNSDSQLRTRWGVGFGPRDCSDYQTGVSIIPLERLTDADRKWMLSADNGGTGGKPIITGMVVEEPDIEIGQGVSSKAISRRMQTDKAGNNGPKSNRGGRNDDDGGQRHWGGGRGNREDRRSDDRHEDGNDRFSQSSAPPPVPAFGLAGLPFTFPTLPNGMPMLPPGFQFPTSQTPSQPPPPGRS
ncbi:hypothetical protein BJ878DRAFT_521489 [Calycina marina]|uniref:Uncharacterized protein n=1 Tax=Calycina marina TaxID=1763456 RepID=A0A9P7YX50_9HELO|nr:hypothetical protein BJ878DRAFT_521489 [Calycina marina]